MDVYFAPLALIIVFTCLQSKIDRETAHMSQTEHVRGLNVEDKTQIKRLFCI